MRNPKVLGVLFGGCAGLMWSIEVVLGKTLLQSYTAIQVVASEAFFASLVGFVYLGVTRAEWTVDRNNVRDVLIVGVVGTTLAPLVYFFGLTQTFAINASLIAHLQPLFVSILGHYYLGEQFEKRDFFAGLLVIVAAILITSRHVASLIQLNLGNVGDLLVIVATVSWAIVAIPGKQLLRDTSSVAIMSYRFLIASLVFFPILLVSNQFVIDSLYQVLLGVIVGLGYIFYYEGLKRIKASHVAMTELSSPFFTAVLGWRFLGEIVTPLQLFGASLLFFGLYVLTRE
jgi:drug/metabolite transporter (DMT)-like permease